MKSKTAVMHGFMHSVYIATILLVIKHLMGFSIECKTHLTENKTKRFYVLDYRFISLSLSFLKYQENIAWDN